MCAASRERIIRANSIGDICFCIFLHAVKRDVRSISMKRAGISRARSITALCFGVISPSFGLN